jgi:hypothetical protein
MSVTYTVAFTILSNPAPAAFNIASIFLIICLSFSSTVPSITVPSTVLCIWPATKIKPLLTIACENIASINICRIIFYNSCKITCLCFGIYMSVVILEGDYGSTQSS